MAKQVQSNPALLFTPSSEKLQSMVDAAMSKCDAHRQRMREEERDEMIARGLARAARGRRYDEIMRGYSR